jgi:hypothetical protein
MGAVKVISNDDGELVTPTGDNNIFESIISSQKIQTGKYHGIIAKSEAQMSAKVNYTEWLDIYKNSIINELEFDVPNQNDTVLSIDLPREVPWGNPIKVTGRLAIKYDSPNIKNFLDNKIIVIKNDSEVYEIVTDEAGNFSKYIPISNLLESESVIQAFFEGDIHFRKSESQAISYKKIKHKTEIILNDQGLTDSILSNGGEKITIIGTIIDKDSNKGLISKKILLQDEKSLLQLESTSNEYGRFVFNLTLPNISGEFIVFFIFNEDEYYKGTEMHNPYIVTETQFSPLLGGFKQFIASDFFDVNKIETESDQRNFVLCIFSILEFNIIDLAHKKKEGEKLRNNTPNLSADFICTDTDGRYLVIDCTLSTPDSQKIDRIENMSTELFKRTGIKFLPTIISNLNAKEAKKGETVLIIDRNDIESLFDYLINQNSLKLSKEHLRKIIDAHSAKKN